MQLYNARSGPANRYERQKSVWPDRGHHRLQTNPVRRRAVWRNANQYHWNTGAVITVNSGFPFVVSGANTGAITGAVKEIPGVSLTVTDALQHWYDGKTTVTLPCGLKMTSAKNTLLKHNACAYRFNVDLSLRRTFVVRENIHLQVAADATNVLNDTEYSENFSGSLGSTVLSGPPPGTAPVRHSARWAWALAILDRSLCMSGLLFEVRPKHCGTLPNMQRLKTRANPGLASGFLISLFVASMAQAQTLPDGAGKDVVAKVCTPCHGLQNVVNARMTKDRWGAVVDDMVARGAEGTDDELDQVTNYLVANFGLRKVTVNTAAAEDLMSALGISSADASAIVKYRTAKGKFKDLQELTKVPGIHVSKIVAAKDFIAF